METYSIIVDLINAAFIRGIFVSVLVIMLADRLFKINHHNAFAIIRWIMLVYAILSLGYYLIAFIFPGYSEIYVSAFWEIITGSYSLELYITLIANILLPFFLFFKKFQGKYFLLILAILMNIGWLFELFVIHSVDNHRDYTHHLSYNYEFYIILKGTFIGALIKFIGDVMMVKTKVSQTSSL